ncbi:TIGR03620 family F420-dependent LLM class oxidoreductase [Amycolatopsis australiensis]|uniref:Probable F420-dependent oxidoreductase, MSMEG_4141 family n=1 Tax=Amycolatopsis australiensis TaxID=546364 RepID=A0A1K1T5B0_9PSEU|nr:TIGR03620 family F420-dependent LLM class oxidoreductase [Amycolatopsis australiensis]SFW91702.1 probable F420-dependent oxidoreductase, MSMEG_4141 family [Amycolatopsis australiensis]
MSVGIWRFFDGDPVTAMRETAAEVEELGFAAIWFGEYAGRDAFTQAALLLAATSRLTVATGIARFDRRAPITAEAATRALGEAYPGRFAAGFGGHFPGARPIAAMREYLAGMDDAELPGLPVPAPRPRRLIAALGPRALDLAAERADGAHPYLVPPEHTALARERLGPGKYLAVEQAVVLDARPDAARKHVGLYVRQAPHHQANLRRLGFTDADLAGGGSDRLVDALVATGEQDAADRIRAHLDAGADHVCVQVLARTKDSYRRLADLVP